MALEQHLPSPDESSSGADTSAEVLDDEACDEEDEDWFPEPAPFEDFLAIKRARGRLPEIPSVLPSQFAEFAFRMPRDDGFGYEPFSFEGRRHMVRPYDTVARRVLLFCARQVEKCVEVSCKILLADGTLHPAGLVSPGMRVASLDVENGGASIVTGVVSAVSPRFTKPCVRIRTRIGHIVELATTHPVRVWDGWKEAGDLQVGDRVGSVRRAGQFGAQATRVSRERICLTAYMIGDGHIGNYLQFTSLPGPKLDEFLSHLAHIGVPSHTLQKHGTKALSVRIRKTPPLIDWLSSDGLVGSRSATKFLPAWVFELSKADTSLFLNRLWATDGHVKQNTPSKYSIEYASMSTLLVRQVQALLWKFGIPSSVRTNWPNIFKKRGEHRLAYILRIETQKGVTAFLRDIGALGKSEAVPLPDRHENNNRDTLPLEMNARLREIIRSRPGRRRGKNLPKASLRSAGLRETLEYPLTRTKLLTYLDHFADNPAYDWDAVQRLGAHLDSDVYWDEVRAVESLGEMECVDIEVADTHNFVADGLITHNSTLLGNRAIINSCLVTGHRVLYVSPSATQTKTFSLDRIKEPLETSDVLRLFTTTALQQNVFEKQFVNRSKITLRYAFLNADRTRGIPAWKLLLDELQDILPENVPIIEQCTSHAPEAMKGFTYAGTPKSLDNILEYYRAQLSTQGEWVVPCDAHGGEAGRYWNILGEKNIGKKGLVCERCGRRIWAMHQDAQWASMVEDAPFESYRIPQLMVPWKSWDEILLDYRRYPRDKFYNEVLGISFDSGLRPLTSGQVQQCCSQAVTMAPQELQKYRDISAGQPIFAGIDWGTGENSYTVVTLGTYSTSRFRIFYVHRFTGEEVDPPKQLELIDELLAYYHVKVVGVDYGGGFDRNDHLIRQFGPMRIQKYQYLPRPRRKLEWDPKLRRWKVHRTEVMSDILNAIKRTQLELPRWEEFHDPYAQDLVNIYSEYNNALRMVQYTHRPDCPDDTFHSILYCMLASMIVVPRPDIIAPDREDRNRGPLRTSYTGPLDQG